MIAPSDKLDLQEAKYVEEKLGYTSYNDWYLNFSQNQRGESSRFKQFQLYMSQDIPRENALISQIKSEFSNVQAILVWITCLSLISYGFYSLLIYGCKLNFNLIFPLIGIVCFTLLSKVVYQLSRLMKFGCWDTVIIPNTLRYKELSQDLLILQHYVRIGEIEYDVELTTSVDIYKYLSKLYSSIELLIVVYPQNGKNERTMVCGIRGISQARK